MRLIALFVLALAGLPGAALAHVTVNPATAAPEARVQAAFRVGHGCEGADTSALRIEMPAGIEEPRPRAVAGFKLAIEKAPDGTTKAVTWTGRLPDSQFELFEVYFKAPAQPGDLIFPVVQTCGKKDAKWTPAMKIAPVGASAGAAVDPHAGHH